MTSIVNRCRNKRAPILALSVVSCWFFFQGVCAADREVGTGLATSAVVRAMQDDAVVHRYDQALLVNIKKDNRPSSTETPSQSLKYASLLLHRASNAVEKDNALAVQLIRQAVSILKYQVIPSLANQHSTLLPIGSLSGLAEQEIDGEGPMRPMRE
ncbi:MAG: hypothetical protein A4E19_10830 [Nitrospira sp. SG-bin1]|nr:MAG: hypothetical protein A4E19_10830 [Nitrospira sp. SG-bin1]